MAKAATSSEKPVSFRQVPSGNETTMVATGSLECRTQMLNLEQIQLDLNAAMTALIDSAEALVQVAPRPQKPVARPRSKPELTPKRSLLNRPNVVVYPAGAPSMALPIPTPEPEPVKGPTSEELANGISKVVLASTTPLTLEQLRARLRTARETLTPVVEQLVTQSKLRVIEVDGVVAYKPPRIEPIRRRRMTA